MKTTKTTNETIKIGVGNNKATYLFTTNYQDKKIDEYEKIINGLDNLKNFYYDAKQKAFRTNFGGDIWNNNSFIQLKYQDKLITINAPVAAINGDKDIKRYSKYRVSIQVEYI